MSHYPLCYVRAVFAALCFAVAGRLAASPSAAGATASPWSVQTWQSDDGLPNNHVLGLAQTPDGYVWAATYSSPARFDGLRFEEFRPKELGLGSHQKLSAFALSRGGGLWLGTVHGAVIRLTGDTIETFSDGLPYKPVHGIVEDGNGAVWFTHQGGVVHRIHDGRLTAFSATNGLPAPETPDRYVCSLATDIHGQLWFMKDGHVGVFRDEHFVTLARLNPLNGRIARANDSGVWIASEGVLWRLHSERPLARVAEYERKSGTEPTTLIEDRAGNVWIGTTDNGLFHFDGVTVRRVPLSDVRISSLLQDAEDNIWVGMAGGGMSRVRPRVVALETAETGLPTGLVQSLTEDASGTLWASTQTGLLLRRARGSTEWATFSAEPGWPGGRAAALAADERGAVWIGTRDRALHRWKDGAFSSWRRINGLAGREIHALTVARNGDVWLALSSPDVVQRLRDGKLDTFTMPEGIRVIRAMAEDAAGNIWVGSSRGFLVRIRDGVVHDETARTTGGPRSIRCLRATPDGALWIGYADEGIGYWKDGRFEHLSSERGFPENNVSQIIPDAHGWLWIAGDHGLFKIRQSALENLALRRATTVHAIRFGQSEGLFSLEANFGDSPGATRTREGRLWIPLRTALAVVDPARQRVEMKPPQLLLKRMTVDDAILAAYGGAVPVANALDLRVPDVVPKLMPDHHRVGFQFAALGFSAPENLRVRHRLVGFDEQWVENSAPREVSYSRLSAGRYRFQVQASDAEGVWHEPGAELAFVVAPFFWQQWWFRLGVAVVFVAATAALVRTISLRRMRVRMRLLEHQAALQRERTRIARDLHDEFGTRLTELGLLAELERKRRASAPPFAPADVATDLLEHIRALERDLDTIVWAVNPKNDTLDHLVGFVCRVSADFLARSAIRCRFEIPDDLPARPLSPELRHNLFLVVREAVNNIAKHADASLVKLSVALEGETLQLRIENDGPGFSVADAETSGRNGLRNMRARIAESGGTFQLQSSADAGTTLTLRVPVGEAPVAPPPLAPPLLPVTVAHPAL